MARRNQPVSRMAPEGLAATVAIVDFGMGNLFSVQQACEVAGLRGLITADAERILSSDAVILPGVGAFGDAMQALRRLDLIAPLREVAESGKPLVGICLGMQLMMEESEEFGRHEGLGLFEGRVVRLQGRDRDARALKVPQVGWNRVLKPGHVGWEGSYLEGIADGECLYFVHSFCVRPADPFVVLSVTRYGTDEFCSSLRRGRVFACQFHPERSGPSGLRLYQNLARELMPAASEAGHADRTPH